MLFSFCRFHGYFRNYQFSLAILDSLLCLELTSMPTLICQPRVICVIYSIIMKEKDKTIMMLIITS